MFKRTIIADLVQGIIVGAVPSGMTQISSPNNLVLVIGRVLVENDSDLSTAYNLSKQIRLMPLSQK
jgi:hypothetical protein